MKIPFTLKLLLPLLLVVLFLQPTSINAIAEIRVENVIFECSPGRIGYTIVATGDTNDQSGFDFLSYSIYDGKGNLVGWDTFGVGAGEIERESTFNFAFGSGFPEPKANPITFYLHEATSHADFGELLGTASFTSPCIVSAPELVGPVADVKIEGEFPVFVWNTNDPIEQVVSYRLSIFDKKGEVLKKVQIPAEVCSVTCEVSANTIGITFKKGEYRWRVKASSPFDKGNSSYGTFTLEVPGKPVNLAPDSVMIAPAGELFTWETVGLPEEYRLTIVNQNGERIFRSNWVASSELGCDNAGELCQYEFDHIFKNGSYSWFVHARNRSLFAGKSKSSKASFTVGN